MDTLSGKSEQIQGAREDTNRDNPADPSNPHPKACRWRANLADWEGAKALYRTKA